MKQKAGLHPRNKHKSGYDFAELIKSYPFLSKFVAKNKFNNDSIDFSNPQAVKALNAALLKYHYGITSWDIPEGYLCPPVPGRADYIHHIAELVESGPQTHMLDIGVGANCIYPLIANREYGWSCVGSDIDLVALKNAEKIVEENHLQSSIELRHQKDKNKIFENIISPTDFFHLTICNPPFHSSAEEARSGTLRKNRNLGLGKNTMNFGGVHNELWYKGGEAQFIKQMIKESVAFKQNCRWFSTLVSQFKTLPEVYEELKRMNAVEIKTFDMAQGQKKSRIVAWRFIP